MVRVIEVLLVAALLGGCASEDPQGSSSCCLDSLRGDVVGAAGCAGAAVTSELDGVARVALPFCAISACERECAPLYDPGALGDYGGCVQACGNPRLHMR